MFIADARRSSCLKVTPAGILSIFAGRAGLAGQPTAGTATSSRLSGPSGVATDAAGNLYIADTANNRVEEVTPADRLSVFAGTGTERRAQLRRRRGPRPRSAAPRRSRSPAMASPTSPTPPTPPSTAIAPALPALSAAPTPTGTTTQGQTLTATPGTWANAPTSYAYGWERCNAGGAACATIAGAGGSGYTLTGDDAGATIRSLVTATNISGATTVASNPTAVVMPQPPAATAAPGIAGTATNLQTLAASPGTWRNNPTKFAYTWQDCDASGADCTAIAGATAATYTLALSDVGDTIRVAVTATNAGGSATATSAPTAVIAPVLVPWANTPPPGLLGAPPCRAPAVGGTLACATGLLGQRPHRLRVPVEPRQRPHPNATAASYTVTAADRGQALSCTVTAINAGGAIQADSARFTIPPLHKAQTRRKARRAQRRRALTHRRRHGQAKTDARRRPARSPRRPGTSKRS